MTEPSRAGTPLDAPARGRPAVPTTLPFDHLAPDARDAADAFASLRGQCPVARSTAHGGSWVLSGHAEVRAAAQDPSVFSSRSISVPDAPGAFDPITLDPPEHGPARSALAPFFSPRRIERQEAAVRALTVARLDAVARLGSCDISLEVTRAVVTRTLLRLLGVPDEDHEMVSGWVDVLIFAEATSFEHGMATVSELQSYLYDLVRSATRHGGGDECLVDVLLAARSGGRPLGVDSVVNMLVTLLYGAVGPSTFLLNGSLELLDRHRQERRRLLDEPGLLVSATEELLRYISPVRSIGRIVATDAHRLGHDLAAGDRVLLVWGAANRDPVEFDEPDAFVPGRRPNRHLAFGAGIHRCLGAHLARLELRVFLDEVLRRLPDHRVADRGAIGWQAGHMCGINRLPITYTPRSGGIMAGGRREVWS